MAHSASRAAGETLRIEGNTLFAKGKFSAAIERYTEAITLCPDMAVLYVNRALCHKKANHLEQQKQDAEKALALDRENMKAHYLLGSAFHEMGQEELACAHLQKALDAARAKDDSIKDEIFRQLARAKYSLWEAQAAARALARKELQASLEQATSALVTPGGKSDVVVLGTGASAMDLEDAQGQCDDNSAVAALPGQVHESSHLIGSKQGVANVHILHAGVQALLAHAALADKPKEVPSAFTCPLTLEPYRDPVITPAGHSYERSALLEHLSRVGHFDPVARSVQVREKDLIPNLNLRAAVQVYLDEHPYGWGDCR